MEQHNIKLAESGIGHCTEEVHGEIFKKALAITNTSGPILEVGFNCGHSAYLLLKYSNSNIISIDIMNMPWTQQGVECLTNLFPGRFKFEHINSNDYSFDGIDFIFIDGDHQYKGIINDLMKAGKANIEWILLDDYDYDVRAATLDFLENYSYIIYKVFKPKEGLPMALLHKIYD